MPLVCLLVCPILPARLAVENVDGVCVEIGGDVDRGSCFHLIIPECEDIDADFEFVLYSRHLVVGDWVLDYVDTLFCEETVVPEWALWIFGATVKGRQHPISKASIVTLLDFDDCPLLGQ